MKRINFLARVRVRLAKRTSSPADPPAEDLAAVKFRALLGGSLDMICHVRISHGHFKFTYTSPATTAIFGWSCAEMLELSPADLFTAEARVIIATDIAKITGGESTSSVVIEGIHRDGHPIWLENKVRVLEHKDNAIFAMVAMRDVTQQRLLQDQLAQLASLDGLTNLHNRRAFDQTFLEEWRRAMRTGDPLSILLLDVDHFKLLNNTYGHQVGDDCLRAIASCINSATQRAGDFLARYGGEEFIIILPNTDSSAATFLAHKTLNAVAHLAIPNVGNPEGGSIVTLSCGVSTAFGRRSGTVRMPEGLLISADAALYRAKHKGRNRVEASFLLTRDDELENRVVSCKKFVAKHSGASRII
jgi:diguanylate cyclase (GGDEF)-like protein/PAS domain S-box-containing protein